jgi:hypothetical protein
VLGAVREVLTQLLVLRAPQTVEPAGTAVSGVGDGRSEGAVGLQIAGRVVAGVRLSAAIAAAALLEVAALPGRDGQFQDEADLGRDVAADHTGVGADQVRRGDPRGRLGQRAEVGDAGPRGRTVGDQLLAAEDGRAGRRLSLAGGCGGGAGRQQHQSESGTQYGA